MPSPAAWCAPYPKQMAQRCNGGLLAFIAALGDARTSRPRPTCPRRVPDLIGSPDKLINERSSLSSGPNPAKPEALEITIVPSGIHAELHRRDRRMGDARPTDTSCSLYNILAARCSNFSGLAGDSVHLGWVHTANEHGVT